MKVGSVVRDMQIIIMACDNNPPIIETIMDTCINAGDVLSFKVLARDVDFAQIVTLTATSSIFHLQDSLAHFNQPISGRDSVYTYFTWYIIAIIFKNNLILLFLSPRIMELLLVW